MCESCTTATQHFSDGTQAKERPLQTSVQQGTSPSWPRNGMNDSPDIPRFGADSYDG